MWIMRFSSVKAACAAMLLAVVTPGVMLAQSVQNGSISGTVTDPTGAGVPNATVTATSPALQVPSVNGQTAADGTYRLINLPTPGVYAIKVEAAGFESFVSSGIIVSVGFNARADAKLAIGSLSQTVEVTGQSPVVDTVASAAQTTLSIEQIQTIPRGSDLQEWLPLVAGVSLSGKPDVGDSNLASRSPAITYGVPLETTLGVEGLNTTTDHGSDTAVYLDSFAFQETEFKTVGNNADVAYPGLAQVAVLKSGSNEFHGEYRGAYENPSFQSNNITAAEAAPPNNLKFTNPLTSPGYYEYAGDLGGRIIRDKLWFYGGWSQLALSQNQVGFHSGPNGTISTSSYGLQYACWTCGDAPSAELISKLYEGNGKLSYQLSPKIKLLGVVVAGEKFINGAGGGSSQPLPTSKIEHQPLMLWNGEIQGVISSRIVFDALFGYAGYYTNYDPQPGVDVKGDPSELETSNKLTTGANSQYYRHLENRHELPASLTFIPSGSHLGGTHQIKVGTDLNWEGAGDPVPKEFAPGSYQLIFNNGVPYQITIYNYPNHPIDLLHSQAFYVTDNWKIRRVSFNLGVRGEHYHSYYPAQEVAAGQFAAEFPPTTYPADDVLIWNDVVPRIGGAWDVRGDGKTVVKAAFGIFGDTMGDSFASHFNPGATQSKTYTWNGPCQATAPNAPVEYQCDVTAGTLASLVNAPPCTSTSPVTPCLVGKGGVLSQLTYPTKQDKTHEYMVRVERQVAPNASVSLSYIKYSVFNNIDGVTNEGSIAASTTYGTNGAGSQGIIVGVPYNAYTIPVNFTDAQTGAPVTIYTYNPSSCIPAGCTASQILNSPSNRPDTYNTLEAVVTKSYSSKWNATTSFWATKHHRWIDPLVGIAGSPNDGAFPVDDTWNWEARASGTYNMPKGFQLSSMFRAANGFQGQRTATFTSKALQQGSVTVERGPYGQYQGPVISLLNVRANKLFKLGEKMQLQATADVFNLLNSSAATSTNYLTTTNTAAPTFGVITGIISPRVVRIGGTFSF